METEEKMVDFLMSREIEKIEMSNEPFTSVLKEDGIVIHNC